MISSAIPGLPAVNLIFGGRDASHASPKQLPLIRVLGPLEDRKHLSCFSYLMKKAFCRCT